MVVAQSVSVTDDLGREVTLSAAAQRVVALAPHIVEQVYAVGSGERLVGAVNYSNYPEAAKTLPRVGTYKSFSSETILRLQPDLVLAWSSGNGRQRVAPIEALGIPVYYSEARALEDIGHSLEKIGRLTGSAGAAAARKAFEQRLQALRSRYADREPISVFYQVWNQPLQTLNGKHLISDVMKLCGGRNVFADAHSLAPKVSVEAVLRLNPQVILASGMGEERPEWLDEWRRWPALQAVAQEQLKFIPPDILQRHTPRVLDGATMMCEHLQQSRRHYAQGRQAH
ncbi:cobalamin-binding protein [Pseudomaricurvus alkylphenolicus]|jgi:iron complex transport system substrate-binding protein|nr:cobalamin-binding protein [Pseudomaricurvus alkylphenolicus]